jgi:hypothetical protein
VSIEDEAICLTTYDNPRREGRLQRTHFELSQGQAAHCGTTVLPPRHPAQTPRGSAAAWPWHTIAGPRKAVANPRPLEAPSRRRAASGSSRRCLYRCELFRRDVHCIDREPTGSETPDLISVICLAKRHTRARHGVSCSSSPARNDRFRLILASLPRGPTLSRACLDIRNAYAAYPSRQCWHYCRSGESLYRRAPETGAGVQKTTKQGCGTATVLVCLDGPPAGNAASVATTRERHCHADQHPNPLRMNGRPLSHTQTAAPPGFRGRRWSAHRPR